MAPGLDIPSAVPADGQAYSLPRWLRLLLTILPPVLALGAALWHAPYLIDDAYITFRYAVNLARGHGLVFNPGEPVLGTTTPLFAIILGLLRLAGANVPMAACVLGLLSVMVVVYITQKLAARSLGPVGAAAVAVCLALHPDLAFTANSGMETGLSIATVYGGLLLALQGRYWSAGLVGGAAFLMRPDGALVALLATAIALRRARRRFWQPALAAALVVTPWLIYAIVTYGSFVPHSVAAKQIIHADPPLHILADNWDRLSFGWGMKIACALAAIGLLVAALRRSELLWVALWMLLYLVGLSATHINVFPWYVSPLFPAVLLIAAYGVWSLADALCVRLWGQGPARHWVPHVAGLATPLILAGFLVVDWTAWRVQAYVHTFGRRAEVYLWIGQFLRERCAPGDAVLVSEVGALSYALPDQVILDTSGINSHELFLLHREFVQRRRAAQATQTPVEPLLVTLVDRYRPRYIVTYRQWLRIEQNARHPRIASVYQRVPISGLDDYFILERRPDAQRAPEGP